MTLTKSLARPVVFVPAFAFLLFAIGFLSSHLARRRYSYGASGQAPSVLSFFPLNDKMPVLGNSRIEGSTTLSELLHSHPGGALVNFWATWCPPCVDELPSLELLGRQLKLRQDPSLPILITISDDEKPEDVFSFYRTLDYKPTLTALFDPNGTLARSVGTLRFPETYWVSQSGSVLYKWVGPQNWVSKDVIQRLASLAKTRSR